MEFIRTANAGVLLKMDGLSILLDGVAKALYPYLGTPEAIEGELRENFPDILAFTHEHDDHYDGDYVEYYQRNTQRDVVRPEGLHQMELGNVWLQGIVTRHIGKTNVPHMSFVVTGSKTVWFMGDATPTSLKKMREMQRPDVLVVPFAYGITTSAWRSVKETGAESIILLHLPNPKDDAYNLWEAVEKTTHNDPCLSIPSIGQKIIL